MNQLGQWVEVAPLIQQQQQLPMFQARTASQPPSQASSISEEIAEEVLAQPEMAVLPTKARASCPVVEEEVQPLSSPKMIFLSSQDRTSTPEQAESESGTSSEVDTVDFSEDLPLSKKVETPTTTSTTVECQKFVVERKVQVRSGLSTASKKVCVLNSGQRVKVVKTTTSRTKAGFVTTKAYVLSDKGQGWVSVNRQHKKTDEAFVFKGQASAGFKRLVGYESVWERHEAKVQDICNTTGRTFTVRVTCPTWEQIEALRKELKNIRVSGKTLTLINKRTPELVNLKRVFGNTVPAVHVFNIDTDSENGHRDFLEVFDFSRQFKGSQDDFGHQVREDLRRLKIGGIRHVDWAVGRTPRGVFSMRDYCTVEFSKDSQLRNFLNNFEKYDFFRGASVKVDPIYENLATVPVESLEA